MKVVRWMTAVAALAFALSVQAPDRALGAVGDPEVILYRFTGVHNFGTSATAFHCTNFSGVQETIRIVVRDQNSTVAVNHATVIVHLQTVSFVTQFVGFYGHMNLSTGNVSQGTAAIAATSTAFVCTAGTVNTSASTPVGLALHGIRFSPVPGTQE